MANPWRDLPPAEILARLWAESGGPSAALSDVALTGADPVLPSTFRIGAVAQASIAASALAAAELWRLKTGRRQQVACDQRNAAIEFRSERYMRLDDKPPGALWDAIAGIYQAGDSRWLRLHTNFAHHRDGVLALLDCAYDRDAVAAALKQWKAEDFEDAAADRGLVVTMMRSDAEWQAHPQGQAVSKLPLFEITKIGEAPAEPLPDGDRPLSGIRVADLTRIIAGPVCGRTLAAHGADVLLLSSPSLPSIESLVVDSGRGKRAAFVDLQTAEGRDTLSGLVGEADVFVQGYRPGGLTGRGFSPEAVAERRPGIVYVSLSAYSHAGPWSDRRGFDSLVQNANGINHSEAGAAGLDRPKALPCQALDHASGYLMAFGAMMALRRRATEGGSWLVRVSLAQTGHWIRALGSLPDGLAALDIDAAAAADRLETTPSGFGALTAVRHAALLSETPAHWALPSVPLGSHAPEWQASA